MINVKTRSGFEFQLDESITHSISFYEYMVMSESEEPMEKLKGTINLVKMIFGDKYEALKKHVIDKYGSDSIEYITQELVDVIEASNDAKK